VNVLRFTVTATTSASPERVLALAGTDFSADRAKVWSNVAVKRLAVTSAAKPSSS
jgi:hypothetical protein